MSSRQPVNVVNRQQRAYYESRFEAAGGSEAAANRLTNLWTKVRRRIQAHDQAIGTASDKVADHQRWLGDLTGQAVLDLGCFTGNELSLWLAENARSYVGLDLSESAAAELHRELESAGLTGSAYVLAGDFLNNDFPAQCFDVVYAHSVLHHFEDIRVVLDELDRVLKPGGVVVSIDPLATEPLNRLARAAYRPFQSDRAWEWPFSFQTFRVLREYFELDRVQGYRGFSMLSLPLAVLPFMRAPAMRLGRLGRRLERGLASRQGPALWICWVVSLRMVKHVGMSGARGS